MFDTFCMLNQENGRVSGKSLQRRLRTMSLSILSLPSKEPFRVFPASGIAPDHFCKAV